MKQTRREVIKAACYAVAAPCLVSGAERPKPLPIAFSTLGCPKWDWHRILKNASEMGFGAIEIRGILGEMDLTKRPEFSKDGLPKSLADLKAVNLKVINLGASAHMHEVDPAKRTEQLDEGKRFIDLAVKLKSPYVRVFGDKIIEGKPKKASLDLIISGLTDLGKHAKGTGVTVLMESHGDFPDSPTLLEILKGVNMPEVGLLWDTHHTVVSGKETPAETFKQLGPFIRHTHIKDSIPSGNDVRYVLPGSGKIPMRDIVQVLAKGGYRGYYGFEWEKAWHPEIEEPEIAFPQYAKLMGELLKG